MKSINSIITILLLIFGGVFTDTFGQKNIDAVIKKCESYESVNMAVVRNKAKDNPKKVKVIINISIKDDEFLIEDFLDALEKDEPNAIQAIYSKKKGKLVPQFYRFENVSYSFSINDNNSAEISVLDSR